MRAEPRIRVRGSEFRVQNSAFHPSSFIPHPSTFRPGFTLVEVLLTLCLLVIISAMTWPQLDKIFNTQRLRKAADLVRIQWCKARVEAMSTGGIRVFRYEVEGGKYRLDELATDFSTLQTSTTTDPLSIDSTQLMLAENAASPQNNGNSNTASTNLEKTLPKDIVFLASQTAVDARAAAAINNMPSAVDLVAAGASSGGGVWSEPIFFYPDGTTSNARLFIKNKDGRMIEMLLRGLTGIVTVGDVIATSAQNGF